MDAKQQEAFEAWVRQNNPRTYPAERQAFEAGWDAAQQDASAAACDANAEAHYLWDDAIRCDFEGFKARVAALVDKCQGGAAQAVPELTSRVINEACWKFIDAMPHPLTRQVWNNLKPAVYAAVVHVLTAPPSELAQPMDISSGHKAQQPASAGADGPVAYRLKDVGCYFYTEKIAEVAQLAARGMHAEPLYLRPAADAPKGEPVGWIDDGGNVFWKNTAPADGTDLYTDPIDAAAIRNAALSEVAGIAEQAVMDASLSYDAEKDPYFEGKMDAAEAILAAIRALKTDQQEQK